MDLPFNVSPMHLNVPMQYVSVIWSFGSVSEAIRSRCHVHTQGNPIHPVTVVLRPQIQCVASQHVKNLGERSDLRKTSTVKETHQRSRSLVSNPIVTTSDMHRGLEPALLQLDPIVVEPHPTEFSSLNSDSPAVSDDVVAAGDGGEDAHLNVHRTCVKILCGMNKSEQTNLLAGPSC